MEQRNSTAGKKTSKPGADQLRLACVLDEADTVIRGLGNGYKPNKKFLDKVRGERDAAAHAFGSGIGLSPEALECLPIHEILGIPGERPPAELIAREPSIVTALNAVTKAAVARVDDSVFLEAFRDIARQAIKLARDRDEAERQRRLLELSITDPKLAGSSEWLSTLLSDSCVERVVSNAVYVAEGCRDDDDPISKGMVQYTLSVLLNIYEEHGRKAVQHAAAQIMALVNSAIREPANGKRRKNNRRKAAGVF